MQRPEIEDAWAWQTGRGRQLGHLEYPAHPLFDNAAAIKHTDDKRVSGQRLVRCEQIFRCQPHM